MLRGHFLAVTIGKQDSDSHWVQNEWSCSQAPTQLSLAGRIHMANDGKMDGSRGTRLVISAAARELSWLHLPQVEWAS